jgi:hypothetical protein
VTATPLYVSTPPVITARYEWKPAAKARILANPNDVGRVFESIIESGKDLTPAAIVEVASDPSSVLHDEFEWRDPKAAQMQREDRASFLLRMIVKVTVDPLTEEELPPIRPFVRVINPDVPITEDRGIYSALPKNLTADDVRQMEERNGFRAFLNVGKQYGHLDRFARIIEAIDDLRADFLDID